MEFFSQGGGEIRAGGGEGTVQRLACNVKMELSRKWKVRMIRIELQIGEKSAVDSTFGFGEGYEDCGTELYNGRSHLPRIPNRFCVGSTTTVGVANGRSLFVEEWGNGTCTS